MTDKPNNPQAKTPRLTPRIEDGFEFDGSRVTRVSFDLNAPNFEEQVEEFFRTKAPHHDG